MFCRSTAASERPTTVTVWDDETAGAAVATTIARRLSLVKPLFVSPHGTGSSRYVSTLVTEAGILATWQQSQPDRSQPLVGRFLGMDEVRQLLAGA